MKYEKHINLLTNIKYVIVLWTNDILHNWLET